METRWNVELPTHGNALYLAQSPTGIGMFWTSDADQAFPYDDETEAEQDAAAHGGEVFSFQRPSFWSTRRNPSFQLAAE